MLLQLGQFGLTLITLSLCLLIVAVSTSRQIKPPLNATAPNVLFFAVDDLDVSLSAYGGPAISPTIDSLAMDGVRFGAAYTDAVLCNPSRTSLITGLRPTSSGIYSNSDEHKAWRTYMAQPDSVAYEHYGEGIGEITTLFQHFAANGYYVASSGKVFHNNIQQREEPWDFNFEWPSWNSNGWPANIPLHGIQPYFDARGSDWGAVEDGLRPDGSGQYYMEDDIPDHRVATNAITLISEAPRDVPFFINVGFVLPHEPRYVPQRLLDLYPLETIALPEVMTNDIDDLPSSALSLIWQGGNWYDQTYVVDNPHEWRKMLAAYYASITYVDEQIGRVLAALDDRGVSDNTIIVFWSDHGYHLGQKQHLQKHTLWRESARVPLIIREPVGETDAVVSAPVNTVDLFPTLVELAGLQMPSDFPRDGRSLVPLIRDVRSPWPWPATTFIANYAEGTISRGAIRTPDWAYFNYAMNESEPEILSEELYDYANDPYEWHNLRSPLNGDPSLHDDISITLASILLGQTVPDAVPVAHPVSATVPQFGRYPIELTGHDDNADPLLFTITELPSHGKLYLSPDGYALGPAIETANTVVGASLGSSAYVMYEPREFRPDQFRFAVSDGRSISSALVSITNPMPASVTYMPFVQR